MGITVHYRGSVADLDRVEDLEDRVIDLALEIGGNARIWWSACDHDHERVVRGVLVDLYPDQETTSLLISPEGWLIGLIYQAIPTIKGSRSEITREPFCKWRIIPAIEAEFTGLPAGCPARSAGFV